MDDNNGWANKKQTKNKQNTRRQLRLLRRLQHANKTHHGQGHGMGKVHGSLVRAGKVNNQAPKFAKAEKKKILTGRITKRFVNSRRFSSIVICGAETRLQIVKAWLSARRAV